MSTDPTLALSRPQDHVLRVTQAYVRRRRKIAARALAFIDKRRLQFHGR